MTGKVSLKRADAAEDLIRERQHGQVGHGLRPDPEEFRECGTLATAAEAIGDDGERHCRCSSDADTAVDQQVLALGIHSTRKLQGLLDVCATGHAKDRH
jgi:hypothetical protein